MTGDDRFSHGVSALVEDGEGLLFDGDYAGARRIFEEAVARAEAAHGARAKEMIVPLMGLARASGENHASAGAEMERELEVQRRALSIAESALAGDDPLLAECLHAHGVSVWANGEPARAVELLVRALAIVKRTKGDAHGYLGPLRQQWADGLSGQLLFHPPQDGQSDIPADLTRNFCWNSWNKTLHRFPIRMVQKGWMQYFPKAAHFGLKNNIFQTKK